MYNKKTKKEKERKIGNDIIRYDHSRSVQQVTKGISEWRYDVTMTSLSGRSAAAAPNGVGQRSRQDIIAAVIR